MLNKDFWEQRYINQQTGWDLGKISKPLKEYIDQIKDKHLRILIPGCGNAYEAEYLVKSGFTNITIVDISENLTSKLKEDFSKEPSIQVINEDFFDHKGQYDLVLEQTFFCAIDPLLRNKYAVKMKDLLNPNGKLVGLLFNREFDGGPPFGGSLQEYKDLFSNYFSEIAIEPCFNSEIPRKDTEVFVRIKKSVP